MKAYFILIHLTLAFAYTAINAQVNYEPPFNLQATVNGNDVLLNWNPPDTNNSQYLSWDAGIVGNSIGLADSGSFAIAARWDAAILVDYQDYSISKLAFFMPGELTEYTAFISQGPNADSISFSIPVGETQPDTWTFIYPETPLPFDVLQDLWVGYEVSQLGADFGAGADFGPAIAGYGDMLNYEGSWISMAQTLGINYNWNIRVYLTNVSGESVLLENKKIKSDFVYSGFDKLPAFKNDFKAISSSIKVASSIIGYHVYRNGDLITPSPVSDTLLADPSLENGIYNYAVTAVYEAGESNPVSVTAQIGNPEMIIFPETITDSLIIGPTDEKILTIYNEGDVDLYWSAISSEFWAILSPPAGIIAPGEGMDVPLYISTYNLTAGNYTAEILFTQNNLQNPSITVPVSITAIGSPGIAVSPTSLSFGDVMFGSTYTYDLTVSNIGTDTLLISDITSSDPVFEVGDYPAVLAPYEQLSLAVSFTPEELGEKEGTLTIFSNDAINPQLIVPLSAYTILQPPVLLQATVNNTDVTLEWDMAITGNGAWLNWDNGENFTGLGITEGGSFQYAVRWDATQLIPYNGKLVPKIAFFPRGANTSYTLKVWKGENASQEILSQEITSFFPDQWNELYIQAPFTIDSSAELWLGMEVIHPSGDFPAGADAGPAMGGYGDMLNLDGNWVSMLESIGIDNNWNLQMFVLADDSTSNYTQVPAPIQKTKKFFNTGKIMDGKLSQPASPVFSALMETGELLGYNVYKDDQLLNEELIEETTYTDLALDFGIYSYGVTAVYDLGESPPAQINVQVGAPDVVFNPAFISDTLLSGENKDYVLNISNEGNFMLEWNASNSVSWLTISESSGSVEPGESMDITLNLNSAALLSGLYVSQILFEINNQNQAVIFFPVQMIVEGQAQLSLSPDTINFGVTPLGTFKTSYVTITNTGNDYIYITEMASSPDVFTTQSFPVFLYPGGSISLGIYFTPDSLGMFEGTFTVFTDDPSYPALQTSLIGSSLLPPPLNLSGTVDSLDVFLDWQYPMEGGENILQYSDDFSSNALGYPEGGTFLVAAKFGPEELMMFAGSSLTQVGFIPWSFDAEFTLKVWQGENAENLVLEQPVNGQIPLEWNDYTLDYAIPIDSAETLWIGYEVVHEPGDFPAGTDFGPAVTNKSDLISTDGITWESLSYWGLPFNWNLRGTVDFETESSGADNFPLLVQSAISNKAKLKTAVSPGSNPNKLTADSFNFLGYNVYRGGVLLNDSMLLNNSEYIDADLQPGIYEYTVTAQYDIGESTPAGPLEIIVSEPVSAPEGWDHHHTAMSHVIHIPAQAAGGISFMTPGDWIGVFYEDNGVMKSGGSLMWTEADSMMLIVYGDNPETSEKEGFTSEEWLNWKVYMDESGEEYTITVDYNSAMPHFDGVFHMFGISALTNIQLGTTSINDQANKTIQVYPNPTHGNFTIEGIGHVDSIRILNGMGNEVYRLDSSNQDQLIIQQQLAPGLHYILLQQGKNTFTEKIIVQ